MVVPKYDEYYDALIQAMHELGGSATVQETEEAVARIMDLSEEQVNEIHRGNRTKFSYRLAWTRNYLKRYGVLENSTRGVWSLTKKGLITKTVNKNEVNKVVKELDKLSTDVSDTTDVLESETEQEEYWKQKLLDKIVSMDPSAFERLCQRILREAGFAEVRVIGKSGDGGIDGHGLLKFQGLVSFPIMFQCKRYKNSVTSQQVRDFRGAMVGRFSKGLILTTGSFTRDARAEANRDGAPNIDVVDGDSLVEIIKDLGLGVKVESKEHVEIMDSWFDEF